MKIEIDDKLSEFINAYLTTDWKNGRDPSGLGALNAVSFIGEAIVAIWRDAKMVDRDRIIGIIRGGVPAAVHEGYLQTLSLQYGMNTVAIESLDLPGPVIVATFRPRTKVVDPDFRRQPKTNDYCWYCQKDFRSKSRARVREVFIIDGVMLLHPEDVDRYCVEHKDNISSISGWFSVGWDCARKIGAEWTRSRFTDGES